MDNIRFVRTKEEEDRLDALLEEVRHKEIKTERDGMWYAILEHLERNDDGSWIDSLLNDPVYDDSGIEVIERRNKLLYD